MLSEKFKERIAKKNGFQVYELNRFGPAELKEVAELKGCSPLPKAVLERVNIFKVSYGLKRKDYSNDLWEYVKKHVESIRPGPIVFDENAIKRSMYKYFTYKYLSTGDEGNIVMLTIVADGRYFRPHPSVRDVFNKVLSKSRYGKIGDYGVVVMYNGKSYYAEDAFKIGEKGRIDNDKYYKLITRTTKPDKVYTDSILTGESVSRRCKFTGWNTIPMDVLTYVKIGLTTGRSPVKS